MEYRLYNSKGDLVGESKDIRDAKEYFGQLYDCKAFNLGYDIANQMIVKIFVDKGKAGKTKFAEYSIQDFLNKNLYISDKKPVIKMEESVKSGDSNEFENRAKNFDSNEQKICLKYIPTGFILGELARRFDEYSNAKAGIASIIENMKIFNKE